MSAKIDKDVYAESKRLGINVDKSCTEHLKALNAELERLMQTPPGSLQAGASRELNSGGFEAFLLKEHTVEVSKYMLAYAMKFEHCLQEKKLDALLELTAGKQRLVMASLSALARYWGVHDEWKALLKKYDLRWSGKSKDDIVIDRITNIQNPDEIWTWVQDLKRAFPGLIYLADLMAITGLRQIEAVNCYNLIIELSRKEGYALVLDASGKNRIRGYFNVEKCTLEHFWFKGTFLRRTKKAYVSFVPEQLVKDIAASGVPLNYDGMQTAVKQKLPLRFSDVREAHGTALIAFLKEVEIDFLHGRVTGTVFRANYFNPGLIKDLRKRAFMAISSIQEKVKI